MIKNKTKISLFQYLATILALLLLFILIQSFTAKEKTGTTLPEPEPYSIQSLSLPEELSFAGEKVPLEWFDVREGLDRELTVNTYWHSQTILLIKRARRYFPAIEKILREHGIPDDFKYLTLAESDLTHVVSPAGATGFWQLLEGTASDYGLEVTNEVDERYHVEKATMAACKFFKESYDIYENWTMVAATYNAGRRGIKRQVDRQNENYYYDLLLNDETARYIYRILAIKLIQNNPEKYGFHIDTADLYYPVPVKEVVIDSEIKDFAAFAGEHGINYKLLKIFNPWLRENYLTNRQGKEYIIKIPEEGYRDYRNIIKYHGKE